MRAACCEATVLSHESILPDIQLLRALWPDREHAPHAGQFFTLRAWGADEAPFLSAPSACTSGSRRPRPLSSCIRSSARALTNCPAEDRRYLPADRPHGQRL